VIQSLSLQVLQPSLSAPGNQANPSGAVAPPTASTLSAVAASPPSSLHNNGLAQPSATIRKDFAISDASESAVSRAVNDPLDISTVTSPPTIKTALPSSVPTSLSASSIPTIKTKPSQPIPTSEPITPVNGEFPTSAKTKSRPDSPGAQPGPTSPAVDGTGDDDPFDVRETVNVLTLQFLSDHAETRIAALEWLLMLHLKAPTKVSLIIQGSIAADKADSVEGQRNVPSIA